MRRKSFAFIISLTLISGIFAGCSLWGEENGGTGILSTLTEEEGQIGKGVNGDVPAPDYSYEGIVDGAVGLYPSPHQDRRYSVKEWTAIKDEWKKNMQAEVDKIEKPLGADATDEDIDRFFNQMLYIAASDYAPIEEINRFGYVIFKKDMADPFTKEAVVENRPIHVEIVLDASGSMAKEIGGQTMMDIAKTSIAEVLNHLPKNAKVGLRVFGHLGNNTDTGRTESCAANELIYPIETLNAEGIIKALAPVEPTGWTSIADSIKNGGDDLSQFKDENVLNILYIITDGIETCGGDPVEAARALQNNGTDIVLGIIGFNVNATQDALLKKIAEAGHGYYANAGDAGTLTAELYTINDCVNNLYQWEPLTQTVYLNIVKSHKSGLLYNKFAVSGTYGDEYSGLNAAITYAHSKGMISDENGVYKKLKEKAADRRDTIKRVLEEEYKKRERESEQYLAALNARMREEVAVVKTTSRVDPFSDYYVNTSGVGGSIEDARKDGETLNAEREERMKK